MKNKQLHNFIAAFDADIPPTSRHQAELRRAVLRAQPRQQSYISRHSRTLANIANLYGGLPMKKIGLVAGGSMAAVALTAAVFTAALSTSPHAHAQDLTEKSNRTVQRLSAAELSELTGRFSGDPQAALKEANEAKDLKTITRADYDKLVRTAKSVSTSSERKQLPGGGYEVSGSVSGTSEAGSMSTGTAPANIPDSPTGINGGSSDSSAPVPTSSDPGVAAAQARAREARTNLEDNTAKASSFVSYTNADGQTVVIGFDANAMPVFKSVFVK